MSTAIVGRPAVRYHGGKWKLAQWIIAHFPEHRVYTDSCGGGGSVLLQKPRSYAEIYNDLWGAIVNVFRVLRDPRKASELRRLLHLTPYAREEFNNTNQDAISNVAKNDIECARRIFRSFAGFGSGSINGNHSTGFRANSNRSGTTPAMDWQHYPDYVPAFVERLRGIQQHNSLKTLHYVDPPYPHATRNMARGNAAYACEMTDADHARLAEVLRSVRGMVVISGYPCKLYDRQLYRDWQRVERVAMADGARTRIEVLWLSPNIKLNTFNFEGGGNCSSRF